VIDINIRETQHRETALKLRNDRDERLSALTDDSYAPHEATLKYARRPGPLPC
jgi:hypothetical protein